MTPKAETAEEHVVALLSDARDTQEYGEYGCHARDPVPSMVHAVSARDAARDAELLAPIRDFERGLRDASKVSGLRWQLDVADQLRACLPPEAEDSRKDERVRLDELPRRLPSFAVIGGVVDGGDDDEMEGDKP